MPKTTINDATIYYELHGTGQPLVIISGYTQDHSFWLPFLDDLTQKYQVLLLDNRGSGQTEDRAEVLSAKLLADDVMALCKKLNLNNPHILGCSMGGTIAQEIALHYPSEIDKVVLAVTSAKWRKAMIFGLHSLIVMRESGADYDTIFFAKLPWVFGEEFLNNEEKVHELKDYAENYPYAQSLENQKRQFSILKSFDNRSKLKDIKSSVLILNGIEDVISLPIEAKFLADHIPNSTVKTFNSGHGIFTERPKESIKAILNFLG